MKLDVDVGEGGVCMKAEGIQSANVYFQKRSDTSLFFSSEALCEIHVNYALLFESLQKSVGAVSERDTPELIN